MVMMRHPLSGTAYYRNEDGTIRVVGKNGVEGRFSRIGNWISGERRTADPGLCRCDVGARVFDLCLKVPRIQFRQELPSFHDRVEVDEHFLDLA